MDVARFSEPSHSKHGIAIRESMKGDKRLTFDEELKLFTNDRKWDVKTNIVPALKKGMIVLMDRYYFSTAAYQGCRGVKDFEDILKENEKFSPVPDLTFFFFADIDDCLKRISKSRDANTYMERKNNLILVNDIYKKIAQIKGKYVSVWVDANKPPEDIFSFVSGYIDKIIIKGNW